MNLVYNMSIYLTCYCRWIIWRWCWTVTCDNGSTSKCSCSRVCGYNLGTCYTVKIEKDKINNPILTSLRCFYRRTSSSLNQWNINNQFKLNSFWYHITWFTIHYIIYTDCMIYTIRYSKIFSKILFSWSLVDYMFPGFIVCIYKYHQTTISWRTFSKDTCHWYRSIWNIKNFEILNMKGS